MEEKGIHREYSYTLFGAEKVGKTNIITRFTKDQFTEAHTMTLQGQQSTFLRVDGKKFKINLHDTAGLKSMKAVWRSNKDAFIFVFAIDNAASFVAIKEEIVEVQHDSNYLRVCYVLSQTLSILIGNKSDLERDRKVSTKEARQFAKAHGLKYMQVSAKTSKRQDIQKIFLQLIDQNQIKRFSRVEAPDESKLGIFGTINNYCEHTICRLI